MYLFVIHDTLKHTPITFAFVLDKRPVFIAHAEVSIRRDSNFPGRGKLASQPKQRRVISLILITPHYRCKYQELDRGFLATVRCLGYTIRIEKSEAFPPFRGELVRAILASDSICLLYSALSGEIIMGAARSRLSSRNIV